MKKSGKKEAAQSATFSMKRENLIELIGKSDDKLKLYSLWITIKNKIISVIDKNKIVIIYKK